MMELSASSLKQFIGRRLIPKEKIRFEGDTAIVPISIIMEWEKEGLDIFSTDPKVKASIAKRLNGMKPQCIFCSDPAVVYKILQEGSKLPMCGRTHCGHKIAREEGRMHIVGEEPFPQEGETWLVRVVTSRAKTLSKQKIGNITEKTVCLLEDRPLPDQRYFKREDIEFVERVKKT